MRFLHTSDWHLGRSFHGVDMLTPQAAMVDGLVDVVRDEQVDAVLVSGDLYDRALPPVDAVELWGETLERLTDLGAAVVVISGNHDSARRLGGGARLLERAGVHVRCDVRRVADPVLLPDGAGAVAVYPVPYLEPDVVRPLLSADAGRPDPELRTHGAVLRAAVGRCRADLKARPGVRSVVMAHAFVAGGAGCDSERELAVGGASQVSPAVFAGFDYVALGHLHGRQQIGDGSIRYAGSPLAYSFSETGHTKGAWLVEVDTAGTGVATVQAVPTVVPRRLLRLRGRLDDLLTSTAYDGAEEAFVSATLTDVACPAGAMPRLQRRFPHAVELCWRPEGGLAGSTGSYAERVHQPDDLAVVTAFVRHVRNVEPAESERALLADVLDDVIRQPVAV